MPRPVTPAELRAHAVQLEQEAKALREAADTIERLAVAAARRSHDRRSMSTGMVAAHAYGEAKGTWNSSTRTHALAVAAAKRGLTIPDLAKAWGMSPQLLRFFMTGKRKIALAVAKRIDEVFAGEVPAGTSWRAMKPADNTGLARRIKDL